MKPCPKCNTTDRYKNGRCKACGRANTKAWAIANPERARARSRAWAAVNLTRRNETNKVWLAANPGKSREYTKKWAASNKETICAHSANRRALKKALTGQHTAADIKELFILQKGLCICCPASLKDGYHVDHIYALSKENSSNDKYNLQLLCPPCNISKSNKHPIDFMQSRGFLL